MKNILAIALLFLSANCVNAQSGAMTKANNLYNNLAYHEASEIYSDLLGSGEDDAKMKLRLADCYYQIGDTESAEKQYSKVIESSETSSLDVYQYAQSLKENGKYELSDRFMDRFVQMNSYDNRGDLYAKNRDYLTVINEQAPYFEINNMSINSNHSDFGGYVAGEHFYFISNRRKRVLQKRMHSWNGSEFLDVYKTNATDGSGEVTRLKRATNSKYHEGPMCFTKDGSRVYFTRNNVSRGSEKRDESGIQNLKLFMADVDAEGNFSNEQELAINSKEYSVGHPTLSVDGKTLYFVSDMPGGFGGADLYKAAVKGDGSLGNPENLGEKFNTAGQEVFPWLSEENVLYFSSDGQLGIGGLDIFAVIISESGEMRKMINLGKPVNSQKDDFAFTILKNGTGFLSSNRAGGMGDDDIYSISKLRDIEVGIFLEGVVTDEKTGDILPEAVVRVYDNDGTIIGSTIADENGQYSFELERENEYTVIPEKDAYAGGPKSVSTANLPATTSSITKDLDLKKAANFSLQALITKASTGMPLEGVNLVLINNLSGERIEFVTPATGDYSKELFDVKLNDKASYTLDLRKDGFVPKVVNYNTTFSRPGVYSIHTEMDLAMVEISDGGFDPNGTGGGSSVLLEINAIYFDLNSSALRDESKKELDRIVKIMNDYKELKIELGSHTDCRQTVDYNKWLSEKRAQNSANYIKKRIYKPERITYKGYGESRLINDCACEGDVVSDCSEEEHQKNRRTEFKVLNPGALNIKNNSPQSFDK